MTYVVCVGLWLKKRYFGRTKHLFLHCLHHCDLLDAFAHFLIGICHSSHYVDSVQEISNWHFFCWRVCSWISHWKTLSLVRRCPWSTYSFGWYCWRIFAWQTRKCRRHWKLYFTYCTFWVSYIRFFKIVPKLCCQLWPPKPHFQLGYGTLNPRKLKIWFIWSKRYWVCWR